MALQRISAAVRLLHETPARATAKARARRERHGLAAAALARARQEGDALSPAFASHLPQLMGKMNLWIHGHVHEPVDTRHSGTRVIANPGGYPEEFSPPLFQPDWVVTVGE